MRNYLFIFYTLIVILIYKCTASSNYVEGDDASTILYHLTGRDSNIQEPYAKYNSGLDLILSFVDNKQETVIRDWAFYVSFFFSMGILFLFIFLLETICSIKKEKLNYSFFFFLPFLMPELLFNSLTLNSANISYFFSILSLIFYLKFLKIDKISSIYFIMSILSFALAVPFRWSIIMFLPIFISFQLYLFNDNYLKILRTNFIHIFLSLLLGFTLIYITGYSLNDFIETIIWGKKYADNKEIPFKVLFATGSAFLTPLILLLIMIGMIYFYKINKVNIKTVIFIGLPIFPFLVLGLFPSYKFLFPIFPILLFIIYFGYTNILSRHKILTNIFLFLGLIFTWFLGVQVKDTNFAYGKSFQFKSPDKLKQDYDKKIKDKSISINFNGGTFMPTLEGGRSIYGYFYVFSHQWKQQVDNQQFILDSVAELLDKNDSVQILQDRQTCFLQCTLYKYGYKTYMPFKDFNNVLLYRDFFKINKKIRLFVIKDNANRVQVANNFLNSNQLVLFRSSYSSLIKEVYVVNKNNFFWDVYTLSNFNNLK